MVSGQWSVGRGCAWEGEAPAEPQGAVAAGCCEGVLPSWCSVVPGGLGRAVGVSRGVLFG